MPRNRLLRDCVARLAIHVPAVGMPNLFLSNLVYALFAMDFDILQPLMGNHLSDDVTIHEIRAEPLMLQHCLMHIESIDVRDCNFYAVLHDNIDFQIGLFPLVLRTPTILAEMLQGIEYPRSIEKYYI
jgi:hypothetical protein